MRQMVGAGKWMVEIAFPLLLWVLHSWAFKSKRFVGFQMVYV